MDSRCAAESRSDCVSFSPRVHSDIRRQFAETRCAARFVLVPTGCGRVPGGGALNVYNWSDYVDPDGARGIHQGTGIKLRYDTFDTNDMLEAKLLAGRSGYDVVAPTGYFLERQIKAGLPAARQVEAAEPRASVAGDLTAARQLRSRQRARRQLHVGHDRHRLQRRARRARCWAATPIDSWDVVFKPEKLGQVQGLRRPHAGFRRRHLAGGAALSRPRSELDHAKPISRRPPTSDEAAAPRCASFIPPNISTRLPRAKSASWSDSRATSSRRRSAPRKQDRHRDRLCDSERGRADVVRQSRDPAGRQERRRGARVHQFPAEPGVAAKNSNFISYANGNLASQKFIDKEVLEDRTVYPDEETMKTPLHAQRAMTPKTHAGDEPALDPDQDGTVRRALTASGGAATAIARGARAPSLRPSR